MKLATKTPAKAPYQKWRLQKKDRQNGSLQNGACGKKIGRYNGSIKKIFARTPDG
jgi:hypothetical protein